MQTEGTVVAVLSHSLGDLLSEEQLTALASRPDVSSNKEDIVDRWATGDRRILFEKGDVRYLVTFRRKKMHGSIRFKLIQVGAVVDDED